LGRALLACLLVALFAAAAIAHAQEADAGGPVTRVRVIRPPEGSLRRGRVQVPGWVLGLGGGAIVVAAAGALVWRASRRR
jgi:hypothetical protein